MTNPWAVLLANNYRDLVQIRQMVANGQIPSGRLRQQIELVEALWAEYREHQGTRRDKGSPRLSLILRQPPKARLTVRQQLALAR